MQTHTRAFGCRIVIAVAAVFLGVPSPASAAEAGAPEGDPEDSSSTAEQGEGLTDLLDVHGFVSPGWMKSFRNDYLAKGSSSARGSFEFTEAGLNFTLPVADRLRAGLQLFARDLGPVGSYTARFDWFYLDYRWADWLGLRAGRTKIPFGLYNEVSDVDVALQPILLPQSIYPLRNRDFLLAQTGGELYGDVPLPKVGTLEYRLYGGTIFLDLNELGVARSPATEIFAVDVPYLWGGRLLWQTPLEGLRVGPSLLWTRLDLDAAIGGAPVRARLPAFIWIVSAEYAAGDLTLAAEYSRWRVKLESSDPALVPSSDTTSERYYALAAYRLAGWFQPCIYYAGTFPDVSRRRPREAHQHDFALSLRFDLNEHWLAKLEGHYMNGTAGTTSDVNDGVALSELANDWGVILVKTTVYF
ncbi:MAG: hypothetical protein HY901_04925 [Deltaproteobacteria bacterium]|nr:hypothetical protein [Deltaproteobacteria bacterium]